MGKVCLIVNPSVTVRQPLEVGMTTTRSWLLRRMLALLPIKTWKGPSDLLLRTPISHNSCAKCRKALLVRSLTREPVYARYQQDFAQTRRFAVYRSRIRRFAGRLRLAQQSAA